MTRVGRKIITVPKGVNITVGKDAVAVKGPKGELKREVPGGVTVVVNGGEMTVARADDSRENRAKHGMMRALLANMVKGVTDGFERKLEINGVGYRADVAGQKLNMALGFSHPVVFDLPKGIAAKVRSLRPPEPYKGKGIKYVEETIKRKVGKTGATA